MSESTVGSGLDDYTAIDGVGPVATQKLHDAGLYTYDDLRERPKDVEDAVGPPVARQVERWLARRLL